MEVAMTIGPENAPTTVTVSISDDNEWMPDQLDDACRRAGTEALRVHGELHPVEADGGAP